MTEIKYLFDVKTTLKNCDKLVSFENVKMYTNGVKKSMLFSIKNLFSQSINEISFKITEFDKNDNLIKNQVLTINDRVFLAKKSTDYKKLTYVDLTTYRIEIEIIYIKYINFKYENGLISYSKKNNYIAPKPKDGAVKKSDISSKVFFKNIFYISIALIIACLIILIVTGICDQSFFNRILDFGTNA